MSLESAIASAPVIPAPIVVRCAYQILPDPMYPPTDGREICRVWADIQCHYPVPLDMCPLGYFSCTQRIYSLNYSLDSFPNRVEALEAATDNLLDIIRFSLRDQLSISRDLIIQLTHGDTE